MMTLRFGIFFIVGLLVMSFLSSFADTADVESSDNKKNSNVDKSDASDESADDSKGEICPTKRSEENIMFGNQQNKPNLIPYGFMGMSENRESSADAPKSAEDSEHENDTQKSDSDGDEVKLEDVLKDDIKDNDKRDLPMSSTLDRLEMGPGGSDNWYSSAPVSSNALPFLLNGAPLQPVQDVNSLYDQEELYRRKRQLRPIALQKRSLRSPLEQMIQTRGRRLPRRSMRFKRQTEMQDLISLLNNAEPNNPRKFYGETIPNDFNSYSYPDLSSYRYPYNFGRQDDNEEDDTMNILDEINDNDNKDDDERMLYPQSPSSMGSRYFEAEDFQLPYTRPTVEENENIHQKWLPVSRTPSIFSVSRRSAPLFYPIDYRYVPGFKKRSFSSKNGNDEQETEFGKWGRVVKAPEAYASAEDVARLYALANLLAENEGPDIRNRHGA